MKQSSTRDEKLPFRSRFSRLRRIRTVALPLLLLMSMSGSISAQDTPNLLIIYADDLGWGDLSCYGARNIRTPHLDRMAAEGVRFTDFYSVSPVCTPARAALLTGRYPARVGLSRVLFPTDHKGLRASEVTLAEALKQKGYATGIIGKWHLGHLPRFLPLQHGFDFYFGIPYSNDMNPLLFIQGAEKIEEIPVQAELTRRYTEVAIRFIQQHRDEAFFLFLSHSMPHRPIAASGRWKGSSRAGPYGDVIQELDWSVGEIFRALVRLGLDSRTAVFFSSDNGSWRRRSNGPLRGRKSSCFEGGVRVPLIARFPGVFQTGSVSSLPAMSFDVFVTVLALAGLQPPADRIIDGKDLLGELRGTPESERVRRAEDVLFFYNRRSLDAVRKGRWKLHIARSGRFLRDWKIPYELYDLTSDPGEKENLAQQRPDIMAELLQAIEQQPLRSPGD